MSDERDSSGQLHLRSAGNSRQIVYEFARASVLEGWWVWALLTGSLAALDLLLRSLLSPRRGGTFAARSAGRSIALRVLTILALVFFFLDLQRRTQRMVTRPSEVAVLVDTSQSMSLPSGSSAGTNSRAERVAELLDESDMLARLGTRTSDQRLRV